VAKHLIDTDLYIDLIQSGITLPLIREIYDKDTPGIYFSSVVAQELLAGARSPAARRRVEILYRPFERVGRVVTPSHSQWKDAGGILAKVLDDRPDLKTKLPALVNDCLLALSARSLGASLYTRNRDDFILLQSVTILLSRCNQVTVEKARCQALVIWHFRLRPRGDDMKNGFREMNARFPTQELPYFTQNQKST
jgi:predicted nucleic acid-binding protein